MESFLYQFVSHSIADVTVILVTDPEIRKRLTKDRVRFKLTHLTILTIICSWDGKLHNLKDYDGKPFGCLEKSRASTTSYVIDQGR